MHSISSHPLAGFPKESMAKAIARGQGKSDSGVALESINFEVILPSTVAMIIETESDNKNRTHMDIRNLIKRHGGNVTPTAYLFQKKGRIAFEKDERNLGIDEVLDEAIEAGAEDVEVDEDGSIVVWTEPNMTTSAAQALQKSLDLKVERSDIIWDANEDTKVALPDEPSAKSLAEFIEALQDNSEVQGIYANVMQGDIEDDLWADIQGGLDA